MKKYFVYKIINVVSEYWSNREHKYKQLGLDERNCMEVSDFDK